jgi:hypothetical protein
MINIDNLQKIAEVKTTEDNYILYLEKMYLKDNTEYQENNKVFMIGWYNETEKRFHESAYTGAETLIKYDYTAIDTNYIHDIFTLVNRVTASYFSNNKSKIQEIKYFNNRFILNEIKYL